MKIKKHLLIVVLSLLFFSCKQSKQIAYYQNIESLQQQSSKQFEPTIQPDDLLLINVSAPDPEAAMPFNLQMTTAPLTGNTQAQPAQIQQQLYLVDKTGAIEFPVIGQVMVSGQTKGEFVKSLKEKLKLYIKLPIVNIRIMNFKITIQGEVLKPGSYNIQSERITLPEALSMAGDLTIYGKRENIILIREQNGQRTYNRLDLTKVDFLNSPFYYLSQNDLIYVEPNKAKKYTSTVINQNIPIIISAASLISSALFSIILINNQN